MVETRERESWFGCRSIYRYRPEKELSNQSFKPSEYSQSELGEGGRRAHGTRLRRRQEGTTELIKLSKVVVHHIPFSLQVLQRGEKGK